MAKALTNIRSLARTHTRTCVKVLAGIVNQADAPHSARVAAAQVLLDRGWGKAEQNVHMEGEVTNYVMASKPMTEDEWEDTYSVEPSGGTH
jgi:hypothetical protein